MLPKISSAFLVVTQQCNLACKYCFVVQKNKKMSYKVAQDSADFIYKNAKEQKQRPSINFFGGEPLLRWDDIIVPLTKYIRGKYGDNFGLSMTTNGVLLDKEKLEFMKKNNIGFMVSIDGNKKTSDSNRCMHDGKSSYDILEPKIPMFLKYNPNMTCRMTLDHDNVAEYFNNHKWAVEHGYNNTFSIVNVFSDWSEEEKKELKKQVYLLADYYLELIMQGKHIVFKPFYDMFAKYHKNKSLKEGYFRDACQNIPACGRCGLGASRFASIGADGTLYSCQEMADNFEKGYIFKIGDIYNGEDEEARQNIIKQFNTKKVYCENHIYKCEECKLNRICDGGCTINNYFKTGDLNCMPAILCYYYQCLYNEAERIVGIANMYETMVDRFKRFGISR